MKNLKNRISKTIMSTEKKARTERKLTDYSGKSDKKHVYDIPDTYIGSTKKQKFWTNVMNT